MTTNYFANRLSTFQSRIPAKTAILLSDPADITYLSGFNILVPAEREALLVITSQKAFLIQATFSPSISHPNITVLMGCHPTYLGTHFQTILKAVSFDQLQVDKTRLFADEYETIQNVSGFKIQPFDRQHIWRQRSIKDETEIAAITQACQISTAAFEKLQAHIIAGVTEIDLQRKLDSYMFELGAEKPAFPTIVAFGPHTSLPHHQPTSTVLTENTAILIDFGARYQGYHSDVTRSFWFGSKVNSTFKIIESLVLEAYQSVIDKLQANHRNLKAKDLDQLARNLITKAGYGTQFIHTSGHGLGLDIHEQPSLYTKNNADLAAGMVITVEPGIYLIDQFGYRYENTVVITQSGCQELSVTDSI